MIVIDIFAMQLRFFSRDGVFICVLNTENFHWLIQFIKGFTSFAGRRVTHDGGEEDGGNVTVFINLRVHLA